MLQKCYYCSRQKSDCFEVNIREEGVWSGPKFACAHCLLGPLKGHFRYHAKAIKKRRKDVVTDVDALFKKSTGKE